mmetsp:Transcript_87362/g.247483  ORF Transcript_87362/g.247483 Transcript_87362/m.247483 type:complete len:296 (+) Transcript_87362:114-1001(+)
MRAMNSRLSSTPLLSESNCWKRTESSSTACSPKPLFFCLYACCSFSKLRTAFRKPSASRAPRARTLLKLLSSSAASPREERAFQESRMLSKRLSWSTYSSNVSRASCICPLWNILMSFLNSIWLSRPELSWSTFPMRYRSSSDLSDSPSATRALSIWAITISPFPSGSTSSNASWICRSSSLRNHSRFRHSVSTCQKSLMSRLASLLGTPAATAASHVASALGSYPIFVKAWISWPKQIIPSSSGSTLLNAVERFLISMWRHFLMNSRNSNSLSSPLLSASTSFIILSRSSASRW